LRTSLHQPALSEASSATRIVLVRVLEATIFYGLIVVMFLTAVPYGTVEAWSIASFECAVFALGLLAVLHGLISGSWEASSLRLFYPLIALTLFAVLQSLSWSQASVAGSKVVNAISADPFESWAFALRVAALTLAGILAVRFTRGSGRLIILLHAIIVLAVLSAIFGIVRQTMQHDQQFLLQYLALEGGYGQFINKNHFAFLVEPAMGLLLGITLLRRDRRERLLLYVSAMLLLWTALVLSRSRGGLLAVTVQMICAAALFIYFRKHAVTEKANQSFTWARSIIVFTVTSIGLLSIIIAGVVWLGGDQLSTGVETAAIEMSSAGDAHEGARRLDIWRATWRMARAHPIAGAGLGGFWAEFPLYYAASGAQSPQRAHNDYLELLASGGIIGAALFAWFAVELTRRARAGVRNFRGFQRAAVLGAIVGIVGVGVHSLVDFGLHITINGLVFVMLLSILSLDKINQRPAAQAHRNPAFK